MFAVIGLIMPLISGILTPFVKAWSDYKKIQLNTNEAGFEKGVAGDVAVVQSQLSAEIQNNMLKVQVYGHGINRFVMWVVGVPVALHFSLVVIDTILAMQGLYGHPLLGVPKLPSPYDTYEWAIVESFFLIQGLHLGTSNVSAWLGRKQ